VHRLLFGCPQLARENTPGNAWQDVRVIQTSISVVTQLETSCFRPHHPTMDSDMTQLYAYLATLVVFVVCDMAWLGTMASRLYRPTLGDVLLANVNLPPAIAFYVIYPAGLVVFAVLPALRSGNLSQAAIGGALLGFFSYLTYDLTNQATLRNWTLQLTVLDITWGTVLGAISATAAYLITARLVS